MFAFLALPLDVRAIIYRHLLTKNSGSGPIIDRSNAIVLQSPRTHLRYRNIGGLAMLRVCRSIHAEAVSVLYSAAEFVVVEDVELKRDFVDCIGANAMRVRWLCLRVPWKWVEEVGRRCDVRIEGTGGAGNVFATPGRQLKPTSKLGNAKVGALLAVLMDQMTGLRRLTFRLEFLRFAGQGCESRWEDARLLMLWVTASLVEQHPGLEWALWSESCDVGNSWTDDGTEQRIILTVGMGGGKNGGTGLWKEEKWVRPVKVSCCCSWLLCLMCG